MDNNENQLLKAILDTFYIIKDLFPNNTFITGSINNSDFTRFYIFGSFMSYKLDSFHLYSKTLKLGVILRNENDDHRYFKNILKDMNIKVFEFNYKNNYNYENNCKILKEYKNSFPKKIIKAEKKSIYCRYLCVKCNVEFPSVSGIHDCTRLSDKDYVICQYCNDTFYDDDHFSEHIETCEKMK